MVRYRRNRFLHRELAFLAAFALIACGGSSIDSLGGSRRSAQGGSGGANPVGQAGTTAGVAAYAGAPHMSGGFDAGGAGADSAGSPAHGGGGASTGGRSGASTGGRSGADAGGRSGAGTGGLERTGGSGNGGALGGGAGMGGVAGRAGFGGGVGRGGRAASGGSSSGGFAQGGASGAGGQPTCNETVATYCGMAGGAGASSCPATWAVANDPSRWCGSYERTLVYDCSDIQALVTGGVDTSTTYFYDGQTHALIEVTFDANGRQSCVAGPTPPLVPMLSCTSTMLCTAGAGGI